MIIFGTRGWATVLAMFTYLCANCQRPAAQRIVKRQRWFTLFFIPTFPFHISRYQQCVNCGVETPLTKEQAESAVSFAEQIQPRPQQPQETAPTQQQPAIDGPAQPMI
ncbi:zinc-ribbon domain-containing protein [Agreia pratensis]|uniref:Zinc-ribbon family protein n=1 Tax=Agreia pratensis TaxID=150121 RepID=A0A1X7IU30_9MICO|nr:zinc-ribbon domain-containing protein [Agreia pratensis]MBF4632832.1 zinc-ribbon domain-containing protein [Agreia pratensis]SMG18667.1 zinc-ribbon family protein [Agreia pratensis]